MTGRIMIMNYDLCAFLKGHLRDVREGSDKRGAGGGRLFRGTMERKRMIDCVGSMVAGHQHLFINQKWNVAKIASKMMDVGWLFGGINSDRYLVSNSSSLASPREEHVTVFARFSLDS